MSFDDSRDNIVIRKVEENTYDPKEAVAERAIDQLLMFTGTGEGIIFVDKPTALKLIEVGNQILEAGLREKGILPENKQIHSIILDLTPDKLESSQQEMLAYFESHPEASSVVQIHNENYPKYFNDNDELPVISVIMDPQSSVIGGIHPRVKELVGKFCKHGRIVVFVDTDSPDLASNDGIMKLQQQIEETYDVGPNLDYFYDLLSNNQRNAMNLLKLTGFLDNKNNMLFVDTSYYNLPPVESA